MNVSIEITFTPLKDNYEPHIIEFIKRLRDSEFTLLENPLSTQIYGEYSKLMLFLTSEIKRAFEEIDMGLIHLKLVKTDRSAYEPHF